MGRIKGQTRNGYRRCSFCKETKPVADFHRDGSKEGGIGTRCRPCEVARNKMRAKRGTTKLHGLAAIVARAKDKPCADCRATYPPSVMDLDHRPGTDKLFDCSAIWGKTAVELLDEIEKCDVVCANCHRIRTATRRREAGLDVPTVTEDDD